MTTEYINYYVWPDGTWVSEDDYIDSDYLHMSDDWFILPLPTWLSDDDIANACYEASQGHY